MPHATDALNGKSLILIFSSTIASAKSSLPLAMAPTNTAMLCVSGSVGRYRDNRTVGASPDKATSHTIASAHAWAGTEKQIYSLNLIVFAGRCSVTGFYSMISTRSGHRRQRGRLTLMTLRSFSGPFTPRIESLCSNWTAQTGCHHNISIVRQRSQPNQGTYPSGR